MGWRFAYWMTLACCLSPFLYGLAGAQGPSTPLPIPEVPDFTQMTPTSDVVPVQTIPLAKPVDVPAPSGPLLIPEVPDFTQVINTREIAPVLATLPAEPILSIPISPNTGMPIVEKPRPLMPPGYEPLAQQGLKSSEYIDPRYVLNSQPLLELTRGEKVKHAYQEQLLRLFHDFARFYGRENLGYVGIAIIAAAPIANTHADQGVRNWYQGTVKPNSGVDDFAVVGKQFGEYKYAIPAYLALSIGGHWFPDNEHAGVVAMFGDRSLRGLAVGAPMVGILQVGLGSGRPFREDSRWHPGRYSNGASGHAFVGAIPFLTAAEMCDNRVLKTLLVVGSTWTGWTRIHDDDHYLSQVLLGWTIACLATRTVSGTDAGRMQIVPMPTATGMGMGVLIQY